MTSHRVVTMRVAIDASNKRSRCSRRTAHSGDLVVCRTTYAIDSALYKLVFVLPRALCCVLGTLFGSVMDDDETAST